MKAKVEDFDKIIKSATAVAKEHAITQHGSDIMIYPCGFAWVKIKPARGKFVSYLKEREIGSTDPYKGGYQFSPYSIGVNFNQSYYHKVAFAKKFAEVLQTYGINATVEAMLD